MNMRTHAIPVGALVLLAAMSCASAAKASEPSGAHAKPPQLSMFERGLVAGGTSRAGSQLVLYPADALRTLAQTRAGAKTLSDLGLSTLISGCATTSAFAYLIGAVQHAIYGTLAGSIGPLYASALGALVSCIVSIPQEVIKQRLVTGIYPDFISAVRTIAADEGLRGFYAGWLPTVSRNVPFVCVTFTVYAALERRALRKSGEGSLRGLEALRIGMLSSLVAMLLTQPFDVVKTRMMTQAAALGAAPYAGVADCVATMWRSEGPLAFFAGVCQRAAYMGPLWALQFGANARITRELLKRKAAAAAAGRGRAAS